RRTMRRGTPRASPSRQAGRRRPRSPPRWRVSDLGSWGVFDEKTHPAPGAQAVSNSNGGQTALALPRGQIPVTGREAMANDSQTVRRTVQFKFTLPTANSSHLASLLKSAAPFYEAFGGRRMRLLQNVDDPARFVHEIEYETHEVIELNRQRVASDPRMQAYLQTWRSLLPRSIEIDVYQQIEWPRFDLTLLCP